jgi:hypothetical protein
MTRFSARHLTAALTVAAGLLAGSAYASGDSVALTDQVANDIRSKLTAQGYTVAKIKIEDGLYEAYARKDGHRLEVFLNSALEIVRTERKD